MSSVATPDPERAPAPPPSPEFSVLGVFIDAVMDEFPKEGRKRIARRMTEQLEWLAENGDVVRLRSPKQDREASLAHRGGLLWWKRLQSVWLARPR